MCVSTEILSLKTSSGQLEVQTSAAAEWRAHRTVSLRLREPRDLFALKREPCGQLPSPRWPLECHVLPDTTAFLAPPHPGPERYYEPSGREVQPRPVGPEAGEVIYDYNPASAVSYFSRSVAGGTIAEPQPPRESNDCTLQFESRFESGNLAKAVKITETYYELYLRPDLYTSRHMQWYFFRVTNTRANTSYRLSIVNLSKPDSLYCCGMRPLMYSMKTAQMRRLGWHRVGENITYFKNDLAGEDEDISYYTLTFTLQFPYDCDTVYFAHCYPYTYSTLQEYLLNLQSNPVKAEFTKVRLLCRSLAGNNVYYLTVTEPSLDEKKMKPAVVVTARVHPGETPSSFVMKGIIDFLTGNSEPAKELRRRFIFKIVPMLNPDGVLVGNNRCSLTGRDLNRQYRTVIRETYPPIWHTKVLLRRLTEDCGIALYCDLHAHSRRHNIFIYGCESRRPNDTPLQEQVFPLMMRKNAPDKFCFESCKFRIERAKEGTGRVVAWMMGVANSFTLEASLGGSTLGSRTRTHFSMADYEAMGKTFCETLLDFCDPEPSKERLRAKIVERLQREGSSADEPTNINLSDYSSDEGDTSSCSEAEEDEVPSQTWSACAAEDGTLQPSILTDAENPRSPRSPRQRRLSPRRHGSERTLRLSPPREHLTVPCLALPENSTLSDDFLQPLPSKGRHRKQRNGRGSSPGRSKNAQSNVTSMPPELIVTQAQVYEGAVSVEVTEVVAETDVGLSLPPACPQPPPLPPPSWQHLRSLPIYRAYYESHRVLMQRQTVEERRLSGSPVLPQGHMWGLPPPVPPFPGNPRPKLRRQKSLAQAPPLPLPPPNKEEGEISGKKGKMKTKFKKSTLVAIAVAGKKESKNEAKIDIKLIPKLESKVSNKKLDIKVPLGDGKTEQAMSSKSTLTKPTSPSKRRRKKTVTRVQSTDF